MLTPLQGLGQMAPYPRAFQDPLSELLLPRCSDFRITHSSVVVFTFSHAYSFIILFIPTGWGLLLSGTQPSSCLLCHHSNTDTSLFRSKCPTLTPPHPSPTKLVDMISSRLSNWKLYNFSPKFLLPAVKFPLRFSGAIIFKHNSSFLRVTQGLPRNVNYTSSTLKFEYYRLVLDLSSLLPSNWLLPLVPATFMLCHSAIFFTLIDDCSVLHLLFSLCWWHMGPRGCFQAL